MNEYLIKYEAPPISEIVKTKKVKAESIDVALEILRCVYKVDGEIFSIKLI